MYCICVLPVYGLLLSNLIRYFFFFISANSLFALPNNQAYVYIMEEGQEEVPAASLINDTLHNLCSASGVCSILLWNILKVSFIAVVDKLQPLGHFRPIGPFNPARQR